MNREVFLLKVNVEKLLKYAKMTEKKTVVYAVMQLLDHIKND
jgi:hypothetical protein